MENEKANNIVNQADKAKKFLDAFSKELNAGNIPMSLHNLEYLSLMIQYLKFELRSLPQK